MTRDVGISSHGFRQTHTCGGGNRLMGSQPLDRHTHVEGVTG